LPGRQHDLTNAVEGLSLAGPLADLTEKRQRLPVVAA
jgi:hypothetical protein